MKVVEYFSCTSDEQKYWLSQIERSSWQAAIYLGALLREGNFKNTFGSDARILLLTQEKQLISFCTFTRQDNIDAPALFPWVGFVFTFPQYRGQHCFGILLDYAQSLAAKSGFKQIYLSTNEIGLYEKYDFSFHAIMQDTHGEDTRVYVKSALSKKKPGGHLLSRPRGAVSSAQGGLTSVFGMGTGISPPPWPPDEKSGNKG